MNTQYGHFDIAELNGKFVVNQIPEHGGVGYYIGTFESSQAAKNVCKEWRPIVDGIEWRQNDEDNTVVTVTRDELIVWSSKFGESRHPLNDVLLAGKSQDNSAFIHPSEIGNQEIATVRFHLLSSGSSYTFSGPGINEFHRKIRDRIRGTK